MNKKILIALLCVVLITFACSANKIIKDDIHLTTQEELAEIDDIGEVLSGRILAYIKCNKGCTVDDLMRVKGIGEQRLKEIKKHYY